MTVSAVIPVKDGVRYLSEVLEALAREGVDEVVVIDSGSSDGSVQIARAAGVRLIEIDPLRFGHGRTRNLGVEHTSGELICFLTQDATPVPGWLAAYREAFMLGDRVGAAYGPHLPREQTSPMIARELAEFFAGFAPDGEPRLETESDSPFLSNVNACYARACWEEIRFRDIAYAEDQAFGADLLRAGWSKAYHPSAAVLHAHDYGITDFMRRYFDEYRGLRETTGHVEPFALSATVRYVATSVAGDSRWLHEHGVHGIDHARWTVRSAAHHGGRRVFAALGSRADRMPPALQRGLSLERRSQASAAPIHGDAFLSSAAPELSALPAATAVPRAHDRDDYQVAVDVWERGATPLLEPVPGMADRATLRIAMIIPPFARGSGGHNTLFQIFSRLERRGHVCSVWVQDFLGQVRDVWPAVLRRNIVEFFAPINGPVYKGFADWHGTDVVVATGWQTVHPALLLDRCHARTYVVNDHEPDFFPASAERVLAADTYLHGMHCIAASPWLRDLLIDRYGATADAFQLGVDHDTYRPRPVTRRPATIVYYARPATARRAVPIGLMALAELHRRRPDVRIVLFGSRQPIDAAFPHEHLGILSPEQLSWLYSEATVGLCLSLTNFSLMPQEMLACGLPCVELAGVSAESIFGQSGPLLLVRLEPQQIADALEHLLDDHDERTRRSRGGIEFVAAHTWDRATDEVEAGLRHALRLREIGAQA
jgi:glycosyltransferase involved in cell wall biosynthesis